MARKPEKPPTSKTPAIDPGTIRELAKLLDETRRTHDSVLQVIVGAPGVICVLQAEAVLRAGAIEDPLTLRNDLLSHTVSGDYCDLVGFHGIPILTRQGFALISLRDMEVRSQESEVRIPVGD